MRMHFLLGLGEKFYEWERRKARPMPLQGKINRKERSSLEVKAPARPTRRQENPTLTLAAINWDTERATRTAPWLGPLLWERSKQVAEQLHAFDITPF